jgi:hypothetical protein
MQESPEWFSVAAWAKEKGSSYAAPSRSLYFSAYAVMSNHLHQVLRCRPDLVSQWSEAGKVAARWCRLFRGTAACYAVRRLKSTISKAKHSV